MFELFGDPQRPVIDQVLKAYEYKDKWVNRVILGDSLVVMNSLLHYEGLSGQVQMIYMDPPYGVRFGSNFQPFVRKRDVNHNDDMTREPKMVKAYRDTWELGLHSYLTYLRDRLLLCRDLLHPSGSAFVQISDENLHHVREVLDEVFGAENFVAVIPSGRRFQELVFELARTLTRDYTSQPSCEAPAHVLFPQLVKIAERYLKEKVRPIPPADILDVFLSPYYGWVIERLVEAIKPDTLLGEAPEVPRYETSRGPGSTAEVEFWTSREVREVGQSHLNYVVADTKQWEQSATYVIDTHAMVEAFVKNAGLGFAILYLHNGQPHDYVPDFIIRLKGESLRHLILATKGFDPLMEVKTQAALRWVNAVNADGSYGQWHYAVARKPEEVRKRIEEIVLAA